LLPGDQWTKVEALFQEASDLSPAAREAFVREKCEGDVRIRDEVLALLAYCDDERLELVDALGAGAASVVGDGPVIGQILGPYRIERELGRGGMAVVYLALRADGEFQKRVAIKLIKRGMDTAAVVERLRRERRILAALEHPSIARLLDGGTTEDGRPWIAMEYVEGLPIDRYCAERNLTIEERCRLFERVLDAVAYAHQNLVVHRDLKPTNILVTPDGNPKLLDFGIAKVLGTEDDWEASLTREHRPLTPAYASPEQMRGGPVATTTDLYSLGVVLYELLAGQKPGSEPEKIKASAMARRTEKGQRWSRSLEGDLDNILLMAMRAEPERRYPTVERMRADLSRHLAGLPVSARKETWRYRCGKFYQRHPLGTPAAALMALAAVAGVVFVVRAERDAQVERHKAEQRLGQLVELANHTLFDVHDSIEKLPGATAARIQIVRTTIDYLDKLNAESGNDAHVLSALASAYVRVARVQGSPTQPNLGDLRGAEQSYVKAGKILDALMKGGAVDTDLRLRDAELRLEYGGLLTVAGRKDEMVAQSRHGLEHVQAILAREPGNVAARKLNTRLHTGIAFARQVEDPAGARREELGQVPLAEALVREYPQDNGCLLDLASLWGHIGVTYEAEHRLADAADALRKSTALREQLFVASPQDVSVQHDLLIAYGRVGDLTGSPLFLTVGDYRGSLPWYEKALAIARQMAAADPSNAQARSDEGIALMRIGTSEVAAEEYRRGIESLKRAEELLAPLRAASPSNDSLVHGLATIAQYRGSALNALGEYSGAAEQLRRSVAICDSMLSVRQDVSCRHTTWSSRRMLAVALAGAGDRAGSLAEAKNSLEMVERAENRRDATLHAYLGRVLAANAQVYVILAKRSSGREKDSDWRAAEDFYWRALAEFDLHRPMSEPYSGDVRRAEAGLAECVRFVKR